MIRSEHSLLFEGELMFKAGVFSTTSTVLQREVLNTHENYSQKSNVRLT